MVDLLYHATIYYETHKYIQESETAALKYEMVIEKAKAHECNVLEYKDHQASHGGTNSAPSYNNPLLTAHALTKRRPSGWNTCHRCGKSHINHFKAICHSKVTAAKTVPSPYRSKKSQLLQRHVSTGSNSGHGKGGGRHHQKKKTPKKPPKQKAYKVTFKNSVLSEVKMTFGGERENSNVSHQKTVLSGLEEEGTYNRFSCFAVHSKMAQSTNTKSKSLEGLYTDTDLDNRSYIS